MFFLQKEAIHYHGVFWIGDDPDEGKRQADLAAESDSDGHHDWVLYKFTSNSSYADDVAHEKIYSTNKFQPNRTG